MTLEHQFNFMNKILGEIRQELKQNIDLEYKKGAKRFFKEKINPIGVRAPINKKIASKYYKKIAYKNKLEIFNLCEKLLEKKTCEETSIAFNWARRQNKNLTKKDFFIFEKWLKKYVNNWAFCDDFCTHAFGELIFKYPQCLPRVKTWAKSKNRWLRRASAVILIYSVRKNPSSPKASMGQEKYLKNILKTADILLQDSDDLVQKGYGWSLKVAGDYYPQEVFDFVMKRKNKMPRTALRYAIEKFPLAIRKKILSG